MGTVGSDSAAEATRRTVRYALERGYLREAQVQEALEAKRALEAQGRPGALLPLLGRHLGPEQQQELAGIYREHLASLQATGVVETESFAERLPLPEAGRRGDAPPGEAPSQPAGGGAGGSSVDPVAGGAGADAANPAEEAPTAASSPAPSKAASASGRARKGPAGSDAARRPSRRRTARTRNEAGGLSASGEGSRRQRTRAQARRTNRRVVLALGWSCAALGLLSLALGGALLAERNARRRLEADRARTASDEGSQNARPSATPAADAAWKRVLALPAAEAALGLEDFARLHPKDPRARDATHWARLLKAAEALGGDSSDAGGDERASAKAAADALYEAGLALAEEDPAAACQLFDRIEELGVDHQRVQRAQEKARSLRFSALDASRALRQRAARLREERGPREALAVILREARPRWGSLDGGAYERLLEGLLALLEGGSPEALEAALAREGTEAASQGAGEPAASAVPSAGASEGGEGKAEATGGAGGFAGGSGDEDTPALPSAVDSAGLTAATRILYEEAYAAFADDDRRRLAAAAARIEAEAGADADETHAARGLVAFLDGDFPTALRELRSGGCPQDLWQRWALARAHFVRHEYDQALGVLTPEDLEGSIGRRLTLLVEGPFAKDYGPAAAALERLSPDGHYRVVTDVGLRRAKVLSLRKKLEASESARARAKLLQRFRSRHVGLQTAAAIMDKAYAAFDKLFALERASEIVPTVYIFGNRAGFDRFSRELGTGATEHTLGYYLPTYRVLVFYDQGGSGGAISRDTLHVLLHETFHQWLHHYVARAPRWFDEGLAEYFGIAEISPKRYRYGLLPQGNPSRLSNIRDALQGFLPRPLTIESMLLADRETFYAEPGAAVNYAQAWSFVHYLAADPSGRRRLRAYFRALRAGKTTEEAFREVFGDVDTDALEKAWIAYLGRLH